MTTGRLRCESDGGRLRGATPHCGDFESQRGSNLLGTHAATSHACGASAACRSMSS